MRALLLASRRRRGALGSSCWAAARPLCAESHAPGTAPGAPPAARLRLLQAALPLVPSLGWTEDALRGGASALGLSPAAVGLLPRGPVELVEHFAAECDRSLPPLLAARRGALAALRVRARVAAGVRLRLELQQHHVATWHQALALQAATPAGAAAALRQRAALADELWHAAGDASTDSSWYTKRGLLAAVYAATEVHMLTDDSEGFADTWAFLDRRIEARSFCSFCFPSFFLGGVTTEELY